MIFNSFQPSDISSFDSSIGKEWLVTNGIGGFACGTLGNGNTRRYHGLLVAAVAPPADRRVILSKIDEEVFYKDNQFAISTNEYGDKTVSPQGYRFIVDFKLVNGLPVWVYQVADVLLEKTIWMEQGKNTSFVRYRVLRASDNVTLQLRPFCAFRDYHSHNRGRAALDIAVSDVGCELRHSDSDIAVSLQVDRGEFLSGGDWYWSFRHRIEGERGLDELEDVYSPGVFKATLNENGSLVISASLIEDGLSFFGSAEKVLQKEIKRSNDLCANVPALAPEWASQLFLAADQFVVTRPISAKQIGHSLIAGFPWFVDWTRDAMIALPGLLLVTGREEIAKEVLLTFSQFEKDGLLPNRFLDSGEGAEYNSVDASLLFINCVYQYFKRTGDTKTLKTLYDVCERIVECYQNGTKYNIKVDEKDNLIFAGEEGVQLTWMDAKVGNWVVTPRIGKPVEINALWYNALCIMREFSALLKQSKKSKTYGARALAVKSSFNERFWNESGGYLFDVVDVPRPGGLEDDGSLRPNQLFATGLPFELLDKDKARQIVDIVSRELVTPFGLRTLAAGDKSYRGVCEGDQYRRDSSYHQGTVWPWLIGYFIASHLRVYGDPEKSLSFLGSVPGHLNIGAIGSISEIFDGDAPHAPKGCFAQAWSVGEVLRAWEMCVTLRIGKKTSGKKTKIRRSRSAR